MRAGPRRVFSLALVAAAGVLCAVAVGGAQARKAGTDATPSKPDAQKAAQRAPQVMDLSVTHLDQITQLHVDGNRVRIRTTSGAPERTRDVSDEDRRRLSDASRRALLDADTRHACLIGDEYFLIVTIDEKTNSNAICDRSSAAPGGGDGGKGSGATDGTGWLELLALARKLGAS